MELEQVHMIALQTIGNLMVQMTLKDGEITFLKSQLQIALSVSSDEGSQGSEVP